MVSSKWQSAIGSVMRLLGALFIFIGVISAERALFEAVFPRWSWLGLPFVAIAISIVVTLILAGIVLRSVNSENHSVVLLLAPLLLNLFWLLAPAVDLIRSRWLLGLSFWIVLLIGTHTMKRRLPFAVHTLLLLLLLIPLYWATLGRDVGSADTFEFQVTAPQLGIAHPTGYPLFLLLGKLWTLILPVPSVAMRLNIGTAIYGLLACVMVGWVATKLVRRPVVGIWVGIVFGLRPTFWSQAVEAEVYTLHAVIVAGTLWLLWDSWSAETTNRGNGRWIMLACWLGFGMTNHVTTVLLLPATIFIFLTDQRRRTVDGSPIAAYLKPLPRIVAAALLPLLLYLYLPLRWRAVNGDGMGFGRFVQWVTGSRFAGALQWDAWLSDGARWGIIGRFYLQEWGWFGLALVAIGLIYLLIQQRGYAIALLLTWASFSFYCLNYYVPDLNVFLLPAHLTMAIALGGCVPAIESLLARSPAARLSRDDRFGVVQLVMLPLLIGVPQTFREVDRSAPNVLTKWAQTILTAPLAENAAILADSDKFPPLYYMQQAQGMRPDLDIIVLPAEAAYRAELDQRVANGQTVYLARFLPRLPYAMRATTPLVEITPDHPLIYVETGEPLFVESGIALVDDQLTLDSTYSDNTAALSLSWQRLSLQDAPSQLVYVRWQGQGWATNPQSQHPVNNNYPTAAWALGEVVDDFLLIEKPLVSEPQVVDLQVALGAAFRSAESLTWHTLKTVTLHPQTNIPLTTPIRVWGAGESVSSVEFDRTARPEKRFSVRLNAHTVAPQNWQIGLEDGTRLSDGCVGRCNSDNPLPFDRYTWEESATLATPAEYELFIIPTMSEVRCGWFGQLQTQCGIGRISVSGVPLPDGAINFADQIGLLSAEIPNPQLTPGGLFELTLNWQCLSVIEDDYTVFVQVLDARDTIVGQVDSWPVQGTYPTSQWEVGEIVHDPYQVQLASELASGSYQLVVGFYRLRDLRRLPVVDATGAVIDDRFVTPNLFVP